MLAFPQHRLETFALLRVEPDHVTLHGRRFAGHRWSPSFQSPRRQNHKILIAFPEASHLEPSMTDSASAIAVGPIVDALRPMISAVVTAIVGVAVTFGVALLKRWTGVSLQSAYVNSLRQAAQTEAGILVAEAADNLSSRSITVTSPAIAAAAARIAAAMPEAVRAVGKTQEDLGRLVAGEIGKLQAYATGVSVSSTISDRSSLRQNPAQERHA